MSFGFLTLSTISDYRKAIGLALSVRVSNPGVPIAIVCSEAVRPLVQPYFDQVIIENKSLRGFVHKVHLDEYSPFTETFFFDADVLIFRPILESLSVWRGQPYSVLGRYVEGGFSCFQQDRKKVLEKICKSRMVSIDGAGHAYFKKPECLEIFDLARQITDNYRDYAGDIQYADEDVMNIAMTMLEYKPTTEKNFFSRYFSAKKGTLKMDASKGLCSYIAVDTGDFEKPLMMHFASKETSLAYLQQLWKLYTKFRVPRKGLMGMFLKDQYISVILWPLSMWIKRMFNLKGMKGQ